MKDGRTPAFLDVLRDPRLREAAKHLFFPGDVTEYFNEVDGHYFERYVRGMTCNKERLNICISPSYIIVFDETQHYLMGLDSDSGKVFINKIQRLPFILKRKYRIKTSSKKVNIYTTEDQWVRLALGYSQDFEGGEVSVVFPWSFRVQGEVVIEFSPASGVENYVNCFIWDNRDIIKSYIKTLLLDRVFGMLLQADFSAELRENSIVVRGSNTAAVRGAIAEQMRKYFDEVKEWEDLIEVSDRNFGEHRLRLEYEGPQTSANRREEDTAVSIIPQDQMVSRGTLEDILENEVAKAVMEMKNQKEGATFTIGDHRVCVEGCLPNSISLKPSAQPFYGEARLRLSTNTLYVFKDARITLTHRDHPRREIVVRNDYLISFRSTLVDPFFYNERNYIVTMLRNRGALQR